MKDMDDNFFIEHDTCFEIKNYKPIIEKDDKGNIISMICCPYIPKIFPDDHENATARHNL